MLASPVRVQILRMTWSKECSAGDIAAAFDMTFGGVSQHLALLKHAGLLTMRKHGRSRLYRADQAALGPMAAALEAMWSNRLGVLKNLAEQDQRKQNRTRGQKSKAKRLAENGLGGGTVRGSKQTNKSSGSSSS